MDYKKIITIFAAFFLLMTATYAAETYNKNGDFTVEIDKLKDSVLNSDIESDFQLTITNNLNSKQEIELIFPEKIGWDINSNSNKISLDAHKSKTLDINFKANNEFNYGTDVVSSDTIKISQNDNFIGTFEFPTTIVGEEENVTLRFNIQINKEEEKKEEYQAQFSTEHVSPEKPLGYTIIAKDLKEQQSVEIILKIDQEIFQQTSTFSPQNNYKIYQQEIPTTFEPGTYPISLTVRSKKESGVVWEWTEQGATTIEPYTNIETKKEKDISFLKDKYTITYTNKGNVLDTIDEEVPIGYFKGIITTSQTEYEKTAEGIKFTTTLEQGEEKTISYQTNYLPIYIIIVVIIILSTYIFIRKSSNPLDIETKIYEIKKVKHEGVKSMKVRVGFENIKEKELDNISIIFRMPSYLNVKDKTFLLTQPNHVLKGKNQYKLIWDFKRFEEKESRIIGFTLINTRGILGDIKIPDLEVSIKNNGKIRKYKKSFPIIKG